MHEQIFFVVLAVVYALVIGAGSWHLMRAERRQHWQRHLHAQLMGACEGVRRWLLGLDEQAWRLVGRARHARHDLWRLVLRHKYGLLNGLCLLLLPAVALQLLAPSTLEPYEDLSPDSDPVVLSLLQGEQLTPPPPLPPELFITPEMQVSRMAINTANREWALLDAEFRQRLLAVYRLMATQGYDMAILEGYRSPARQNLLAKLGPHVTGAAAFQSYHQYGLAADSAFYRNGKIVISETDPWAMEGYRLYGKYAESVGLVWGGNWKMRDFGHVELRKPGVLRRP